MRMNIHLLATSALLALCLAGCGEAAPTPVAKDPSVTLEDQREVPDSTGPDPAPTARPTVDETRRAIESDFTNMGYTDEVALCAARVLVNSKLSDSTLRAAIDGVGTATSPPLTTADEKVLNSKAFKTKYKKCTAMLPSERPKSAVTPSN